MENSSTREHVENYLKDLPDKFSYDELRKIVRKEMLKQIPPITIWGWKIISMIREVQKDLKMGRIIRKNYNFLKSSEVQ